ncbi:MAG: GntR family transcriptional regulator [Leucobacter sp.]
MALDPAFAIRRKSAAELVADTLRDLIVTGKLQAGEPLRESQLAKDLQISRNSLREGIRLLEQSRLVKYEMHRGAVVTDPNIADLTDLYRTRLHLETLAARVPATDEQLDRVEEAFAHLQLSADTAKASPIVTADLELHQAIVGLLGSERISTFFAQICKEMVFYLTLHSYADEEYATPKVPIVDPHAAIVDALRERRSDDAVELIRQHLEENFTRLKTILEERLETNG